MRKFVNRLRDQQGFTLIEMLPTLLLLTMVMTAVYAVATFGMRSYQQINTENLLREEGDIMMSSIITQLYTFAPERVRQLTDADGHPAGIRLEKEDEKLESKDVYICGGKLYLGATHEGSSLQLKVPSCTAAATSSGASNGAEPTAGLPTASDTAAQTNTVQSAVTTSGSGDAQLVAAQSVLEAGSIIEIDGREAQAFYESGIIQIHLKLSHPMMGGETAQTSLESKFGF